MSTQRNSILNYLAHVLTQVGAQSATATANVVNSSVDSVTVDASGLYFDDVVVSIESPGVVTPNAYAVLSGNSISEIVVDRPGGRYNELFYILTQLGFVLQTQSGDSLVSNQIKAPAVTITGTANAYASVNAEGSVTSVTVDNGGSAYTTPPEVQFEAPTAELDPARARARVRRGIIESIEVIDGSHSYTFVPTVTVSSSVLQFNTSVSQVSRGYRYLDDINDFPYLTFSGPPIEDYEHNESGQIFKKMQQSIRGYVLTDENSISSTDNLARDIETVVENFAYLSSNLGVYSASVTQVVTDEGLLSPYGHCDVQVEISYESTN